MSATISSEEAVNAALRFEPSDYICVFDQYWGGFLNRWREAHGLAARDDVPHDDVINEDFDIQRYYRIDVHKLTPVEEPWPSAKARLGRDGDFIIERDGWGRVVRRLETSPYGETLEAAVKEAGDIDSLRFEPADLDARHSGMLDWMRRSKELPHRPWLYLKVGGPYLRSSFLRGEMQWYLDIKEDPEFAGAVAARVTDHLIAVGREALKRCGGGVRSIWIYDDVAYNNGLLMSPASYESLFLPQVRRMVAAFGEAGASHVGYHSDGDIRAILDGLVDVGITIVNPVEPRAHMDVVELRRRYGRRLSFVGGLCNSHVLPFGTPQEVRRHVERAAGAAREGGLVVGSHTISNDMTLDRYEEIMRILGHAAAD